MERKLGDMGACLSHHQVDVVSWLHLVFTENSIRAMESSGNFTDATYIHIFTPRRQACYYLNIIVEAQRSSVTVQEHVRMKKVGGGSRPMSPGS